ncbi:hypothetical protein BOTCAL_0103g00110 [Botryotinia calthae]|uniref:Uncharacterized protein n=1 Tax=Botryotinia calthae TaxID=38488 RepID=A0A4Y8D8C2_9HELO|nr:hypothetical protein BOTCAL_0103g00110 [Botryotinia calthae]
MTFHRVQTWYPSFNDIQPNPNSPFREVVPQVLDIPLNPQEIHYREICGMLKYAEDNKRRVTQDKKRYSRELRVALMRLDVGGGEGRDGRERIRKVAVLQKSYKNGLMVCEGELLRKEKELKGLLKLQVQENGNAGYYEGRNWWFVAEAEESDEEDEEDDDEDDDHDKMDEGGEGEETEGMELECWSEEDDDEEMEME